MLETKIVEQDTYTFVGRLRILQEGKKQMYDNAIRYKFNGYLFFSPPLPSNR